MADWQKRENALIEEIGRLANGWQAERDYLRTVMEVHYRAANPDSQAMITALLKIVKAPRG